MSLVNVNCEKCNKVFTRPVARFNEAIKFGWNQYCSKECADNHKTKRKNLPCDNCGKVFEKALNQITEKNYCSRSCAAIVNNKKYPKKEARLMVCANCSQEFKKWTVRNNKKYCSMKCKIEKERFRPEELLKIIQKSFKELKRVPSRRELSGGANEASRKYFGSWNKAILAAGLTPNRSHNNRMYKRTMGKALDGHLCDSISELLIDNWLYKNKIAHEKDVRYPNTNHKADWRINKNVLVEYFGLLNDSPRYDKSIKEKQDLCKQCDISLISIYPQDIYPKIHLENNLKTKFRDYLAA